MLNNSGNCREVCIHLILTEPLGQQEKRDSSPSSVIFLILQLMNDGQPARLGRSYSEGHLRTHLRINVAQQLYIKSKTASRHFNIVTAARDYPPHPRTSIGQPAGRLLPSAAAPGLSAASIKRPELVKVYLCTTYSASLTLTNIPLW